MQSSDLHRAARWGGDAACLSDARCGGRTLAADPAWRRSSQCRATTGRSEGVSDGRTVKENQPKLCAAPDALPWRDAPVAHEYIERGHDRLGRRTIQVLPVPDDPPFPHVRQATLIERYVSDLNGDEPFAVAGLGVTSLPVGRADPARLATLVRGHWGIESLHWLRDSPFREGASQAALKSGPRGLAAPRNLAIGAIRLLGRTDIAETTRWANRFMHRPCETFGLR